MENKETLEEVAQWTIDNRYPKSEFEKVSDTEMYHTIIEKVSKWQQQQDKNKYSEEEVRNIIFKFSSDFDTKRNIEITLEEQKQWFEQFKKK